MSSLRENYKFNQNTKPTIGVDLFFSKRSSENVITKFAIWDYNGQVRYQSGENQIKPMDAYILVYDITNYESFASLADWMTYIESNPQVQNPQYFIVGNKLDLDFQRKVKPEEVAELAKSKMTEYYEVSSKHQMFAKTSIDRILSITNGSISTSRELKLEENSECCCSICKIF